MSYLLIFFNIFVIGKLHATLCKILQASGGAIAGDYFFS
jgi:hypothetical protein